MLFNVPEFIDIEDKIVGPLTAKQLGWLALGGVILMVLWNFLDNQAFIMAAIICAFIFGALAFYRPYGQPLFTFVLSSVYFTLNPKMYIWHRLPENIKTKKKLDTGIVKSPEKKQIDVEKLNEIASMLDRK